VMLALWMSNPEQRSYMTLICVLLLRRRAEDVGSVESPSRALQPDLAFAHFPPKADNLWYHCNVQIKLVNGLAVATAAPHLNDLRAARWRSLLSNSQAISGPLFMIRGVAKTWGTRYRKSSAEYIRLLPWHGLAADFRSTLATSAPTEEKLGEPGAPLTFTASSKSMIEHSIRGISSMPSPAASITGCGVKQAALAF
jgi:hypothetical protein